MREFPKPNVVVSKCITFAPVRYNAQIIASDFVDKLKPYVSFIPVCPEVEIGLGVPREQNLEKMLTSKFLFLSSAQYASPCSKAHLFSLHQAFRKA
jgi:uncharacterized protein YbbK (DUF523 family)